MVKKIAHKRAGVVSSTTLNITVNTKKAHHPTQKPLIMAARTTRHNT
jgi:hypothetical protein